MIDNSDIDGLVLHNDFAKRLQRCIDIKGVDSLSFVTELGLDGFDYNTAQEYLSGARTIDKDMLHKVSKALNISEIYMLGFEYTDENGDNVNQSFHDLTFKYNDIIDAFRKRIIKLRHNKRYTQDACAELLGVNAEIIERLESGEILPNPEIVKDIAVLFDTTPMFLVGWDTLNISHFSDLDIDFINKYNRLSDKKKLAIDTIMDSMQK